MRSQHGHFFACMLHLSWLAGVPLPVASAVFDMGKRGHKKNRRPLSYANVHACNVMLSSLGRCVVIDSWCCFALVIPSRSVVNELSASF